MVEAAQAFKSCVDAVTGLEPWDAGYGRHVRGIHDPCHNAFQQHIMTNPPTLNNPPTHTNACMHACMHTSTVSHAHPHRLRHSMKHLSSHGINWASSLSNIALKCLCEIFTTKHGSSDVVLRDCIRQNTFESRMCSWTTCCDRPVSVSNIGTLLLVSPNCVFHDGIVVFGRLPLHLVHMMTQKNLLRQRQKTFDHYPHSFILSAPSS